MAGPSNLKTLKSFHISSNNIKPPLSPPPSSSSSSFNASMKLKTLLQTLVFSHMYLVARALARTKSVLIHVLSDVHFLRFLEFPLRKRNRKGKQKKLFFGSFRLHYNWCDSSWNSVVQKTTRVVSDYDEMQLECLNSELSKYLQWLEKKGVGEDDDDDDEGTEIDKLADLFIANCHEKFRLEKQESYRRFQEMMARSV